jgi:hypothetical protein
MNEPVVLWRMRRCVEGHNLELVCRIERNSIVSVQLDETCVLRAPVTVSGALDRIVSGWQSLMLRDGWHPSEPDANARL